MIGDHSDRVRRQEFLGAVSGVVMSPLVAYTQAKPVIGFLHVGSPEENKGALPPFAKGWKRAASRTECRDRLPLGPRSKRKTSRIGRRSRERTGGADRDARQHAAAVAAKKATGTIPIVFSSGNDPVELGIVARLSRPGGNATGITSLYAEVAAKRIGVFRKLAPNVSRYFTLVKPTSASVRPLKRMLQRASASASRC